MAGSLRELLGMVPQENGTIGQPNYGNRPDGTRKGSGFLGPMRNSRGQTMTEYSVGINVGGKDMDVPTFVPTLSPSEVQTLLSIGDNQRIPDSIIEKAAAHARMRLSKGLPVFATEQESPKPNPSNYVTGTIGQPYRPAHMEALGSLASLLEKAGQYASKVGVTVPQGSPILPGASLTLRDLTIGDLPRVLEDISYGMGPTTGGNYATGGIGTLGGMKSDVFELANAAPGAALLGKGLAKGGKALAPTAAEMLRQRAEKYMRDSGNLKEIIAYHGTPHNWQPEPGFPDGRFRLDKMGTGEGAQAYGWGAYFAESPEVANVYRNTLAKDGGAVYELDIPDEAVARMLDWDAPLSGQTAGVQKFLADIPRGPGESFIGEWLGPRLSGGADAYWADDMRKAGIPGLRFLDAGSRGAGGSGTRNIVVWDQDVLDEAARRGVKKK